MEIEPEPHLENGKPERNRRNGSTAGRLFLVLGFMAVMAAGVAYAVTRPERSVTTRSEEAYAHYEKGMEALRSHYLPEAASEWRQAVAIDSTFAMAWVRLARLSRGAESEHALAVAQSQMGRIREKERLHVRLLAADMMENDAEKQALVAELLKKFPDDIEMLMIAGNRAFHRGDFPEALSCYRKLVAQDPKVGQGYNMMGYTLSELGRYDEATEALQKYTFLTPAQPNPHDSLGELYFRTGRYEAAIAEFDKATALKTDFGWSAYHKAMVLSALGRYNEAIDVIEQVKKDAPNPPDSEYWYRYEALLRHEAGDSRRALDLVRDLEERFPDGIYGPCMSCYIHSRNGRVKEATAEFDRMTRKIEEACKLELKPAYAQQSESLTHEMNGYIAEASGDWTRAADEFSKSIAKVESSMDQTLHIELMRCLVQAGRPDEAMETGRKILAMNPSNPKANFWCGVALETMARADDALPYFRRTAEILAKADPGNEILEKARQRLGQS